MKTPARNLAALSTFDIRHWTFLAASAALVAAAFGQTGPPTLRPRVQVQTSLGDFVLELDAEKAPVTVINFLDYVQAGFYDGTIFHRVSAPTVVQGGAYTVDMIEKKDGLRSPIPSESYNGLKNEKWTVAMYRIPGDPSSARAQFFINTSDNAALDRLRDGEGYTVFGRVVEGVETVERIRDTAVSTHPKYAAGKNPVVPVTPVLIKAVRIVHPLDKAAATALAQATQITPDKRLNALINRFENEIGKKLTTTESGLRYIDRSEGRGAFPHLEEAVEINYRGTLIDGREFDTSDRQTEGQGPYTTNVETMIRGLREGLLTMREGGKRILIVPPELGYPQGIPGRIPANATLVFEVELLAVKPPVKRPTVEPVENP